MTTNAPKTEQRTLGGTIAVRAAGDGGQVLEGYAAVFGAWSLDLGGFVEQVAPGAFRRTLREQPDVRALFDHDAGRVLGRTAAGTLELREDDHGLLARIVPPDTTAGRDVLESVRRGDLAEMSFGFRTRKDAWEWGQNGANDRRTLLDVELLEVSVVAFPAYPDTSVALASRARHGSRGTYERQVALARRAAHLSLRNDYRAARDALRHRKA